MVWVRLFAIFHIIPQHKHGSGYKNFLSLTLGCIIAQEINESTSTLHYTAENSGREREEEGRRENWQ
jgi:hypothetical protein